MPRQLALDRPIRIGDEVGTVEEAVLRALALGVPRRIAAQSAGIAEATLHSWTREGREIAERIGPHDERDTRLLTFLERVEKADADAYTFAVAMVKKAMPDSWQAAMTYLERRHPKEWARQDRVHHGGEVDVKVSTPFDTEVADLVEKMQEAAKDAERV